MPRKGQSLDQKSIEKIKASKVKRLQSKYNWDLATPYLDVLFENGKRNRTKAHASLREFQDLIKSGMSLLDIKRTGVSKHLVGFFSNFCQGKVNLIKDDFEKDYVSGMSLEDISDKYEVSRNDVTYLREMYDIKVKGATYQNRKKTETLLTNRQKEILYGSMMGDAKRQSSKYNSSAGFVHGDAQKDYLLWKYKEFENVASAKSLKSTSSIDIRSGNTVVRHSFYTQANSDVEECINLFYKDKKEVSREILDKLSLLSVSVWFMDDGKTDFKHQEIKKMYPVSPVCTFCTDSFSKDSCENIRQWFEEKYNIKTRIIDKPLTDRLGHRIIVCNESTNDFIGLIKPYVLPMFQYKVDYEAYLRNKTDCDDYALSDIIRCPVGNKFKSLYVSEQDGWVEKIVSYWHSKGIQKLFGNPKQLRLQAEKVMDYDTLKMAHSDCIGFNSVGNAFLMSHFHHFYQAKAKGSLSVYEIFESKRYLSEVVRQVLLKGHFPRGRKVLREMRRYRGNKAISGFMPCVAKAIYDKYCQNGDRVLDFCAGYGGRMFGSMASDKVLSYTGIEINTKSYCGILDTYSSLKRYCGVEKEVSIFNQDSLIHMKTLGDHSFDYCFTSVPYFDAEEYGSDVTDNLIYSKYSEWFEEFLIKSIEEALRVCKRVSINVANTGGYLIADDLERYLKTNNIGFTMDRIRLPKYGKKVGYEPIFNL